MANVKNCQKEGKMTEWFGKRCKYQICQWEDTEVTGGPDYMECYPVLIFCNHKDNPNGCEGNCHEEICPIDRVIEASLQHDIKEDML